MRNELAQDGEILKLYYGRLHALTAHEPMSKSGFFEYTGFTWTRMGAPTRSLGERLGGLH